jgi:hypothetical protein
MATEKEAKVVYAAGLDVRPGVAAGPVDGSRAADRQRGGGRLHPVRRHHDDHDRRVPGSRRPGRHPQQRAYVATDTYPFGLNTPTWGWIDLIVGLLVAGAGWAVFSGRTWGRIVGIILAALSAVANFLFIPYYPFWAILIVVLDVFVIWALAVHGREMSEL